jgi:hypothetical protein
MFPPRPAIPYEVVQFPAYELGVFWAMSQKSPEMLAMKLTILQTGMPSAATVRAAQASASIDLMA